MEITLCNFDIYENPTICSGADTTSIPPSPLQTDDHAVPKLPDGIYGSRMTDLTAHRHIDIAIGIGVVIASLATGQEVNESEYMKLSYGTTLVNDLVDVRSDIMRKHCENPIVRGVRGCLCQYFNRQIGECLESVTELVESKQLLAMVIMGFCNWAVMASHHKAYELVHGVRENTANPPCKYHGLENLYEQLLIALPPYGSLGADGPTWGMERRELDKKYSMYRRSPETHLAWLADVTWLLLAPVSFRKIVDVVHYP